MKKQLVVMFAALFLTLGSVFAQGPQRMSVDERVKLAMDKVENTLKPSEGVRGNVKTILYDYYNAQQKKMEELRSASERPSREEMMKVRQQLDDERDAKLKAVLSAEQYTKWKDEVEPSLRPQPKGGEGREKKDGQ
ncbi:MAG: hypothetical protein QM687_02810 [Ferruginibacter sp.]